MYLHPLKVVKIKILNVLLGLVLVLLMVPMVSAQNEFGRVVTGGKLIITDVDVKVDDRTDKDLDFGETITREAKPDSTVRFTIEAKNNFTDVEDLDIENIEVTATIEGIDNDDDLDEEGEMGDIRAGRDDSISIEFKIPMEVDEGNYDVLIEVTGEDENGTDQTVEYELELEVQKEDHEVRFKANTLSPSELACQRSAQLSVGVINTGAEEEDGVVLEVTNTELDVDFREVFDLTNDPFESDSKFSKTYTIRVPDDQPEGIYTVVSQVTFDDGGETITNSNDLVVGVCEALKKAEEPKVEEKKEEPEVVVVTPQPTAPTPTVPTASVVSVTQPTAPATVTEEKSLLGNTWFLAALIGGEMLVVFIAILLVVALRRR